MISLRQYLTEQSSNFDNRLDALLFDARFKYINTVKDELKMIGVDDVEWSDATEELIDAGGNGTLAYTLEDVAIGFSYQGHHFGLRFHHRGGHAICSIWNEKTKHLEMSEPLPTIQHVKRSLAKLIEKVES